MKHTIQLVTLLCIVTVCGVARAQTWTETAYSVTNPEPHSQIVKTWYTDVPATYVWTQDALNFFTVWGSSTQEPAWRNLFANICNNPWFEHKSFAVYFGVPNRIDEREYYTTRTGVNSFERTNPTETASRNMAEHLTTFQDYIATPLEEEPPGGGS